MAKLDKFLILISYVFCVIPALAQTQLDYSHKFHNWFIQGWTDGIQISCGGSNEPEIKSTDYFDIYKQIWVPNALGPGIPAMTFWDVDIGTNAKEQKEVQFILDVDNKFHAVSAGRHMVYNSQQPHVNLVGLDTEGCALEPLCVESHENTMITALASELTNAKNLRVTLQYDKGLEVHQVDVSEFSIVRKEIDKCIDTIRPRLSLKQK